MARKKRVLEAVPENHPDMARALELYEGANPEEPFLRMAVRAGTHGLEIAEELMLIACRKYERASGNVKYWYRASNAALVVYLLMGGRSDTQISRARELKLALQDAFGDLPDGMAP